MKDASHLPPAPRSSRRRTNRQADPPILQAVSAFGYAFVIIAGLSLVLLAAKMGGC